MLEHMYNEKLTYKYYGNWVIFWENQEDTKIGDIRIVFRLADFVFESSNTRERLETALNQAIENENYEYAAKLRDEINKEKQTNGK
jgi:excinuclease UvrABC helicase subunit UvrB